MNSFQKLLVSVIVAVILSSCAQRGSGSTSGGPSALINDEVVVYESCMGEILNARDKELEVPHTIAFVKDLVGEMFSCENFRGAPVKFFGKKVRIQGRSIHAGYGYALADRKQVISELLSKENFKGYYYDPRGRFKVSINRRLDYVRAYDRTVPTYIIVANVKYIGKRTIGALSVIDFSQEGRDYTAFLWIHGLGLTQEKIVSRFEKLLRFIASPSQFKVVLK